MPTTIPALALRSLREYWLMPLVTTRPGSDVAVGELGPRATWLNFEQDMGMAGFRQSKLSYQPAALLPKYRLRAESPLP